jgi:hypothetical protein
MEVPARPRLRIEELRTQLDEAASKLEHIQSGSSFDVEGDRMDAIVSALHATALAFSASMGECQAETPYAPVRPVIDPNGEFKWCCNHPSEHCTSRG